MNYFNYFTEIEEHFVRRRGKNLIVSPMDWSLITAWRDSGVPLHVALRGIDIAMDKFFSGKRRPSERPGTLFYCHDAVMAEYSRHLEAHLGEAPPPAGDTAPAEGAGIPQGEKVKEGPTQDQVLAFIRARISEIEDTLAKHSFLESTSEGMNRVVSRLEEIAGTLVSGSRVELEALERDLGILDDVLIAELLPEISKEEMLEWEQTAKKELKIYRKRLPKETYEKIHANFIQGSIHRKYNVGELSLFHL